MSITVSLQAVRCKQQWKAADMSARADPCNRSWHFILFFSVDVINFVDIKVNVSVNVMFKPF
jgi:hypothetical protein